MPSCVVVSITATLSLLWTTLVVSSSNKDRVLTYRLQFAMQAYGSTQREPWAWSKEVRVTVGHVFIFQAGRVELNRRTGVLQVCAKHDSVLTWGFDEP